MTQPSPQPLPILSRGSHDTVHDGTCLLEAASVYGGLPFSDHPPGVCGLIRDLGTVINDGLTHTRRQALAPLIPDLLRTQGSEALDEQRRDHVVRWFIRDFFTPHLTLTPGVTSPLAARLRAAPLQTPEDVRDLTAAVDSRARTLRARPDLRLPEWLTHGAAEDPGGWAALHLLVLDVMQHVLAPGLWASDWGQALETFYDAAVFLMAASESLAQDAHTLDPDTVDTHTAQWTSGLIGVYTEICRLRDA